MMQQLHLYFISFQYSILNQCSVNIIRLLGDNIILLYRRAILYFFNAFSY